MSIHQPTISILPVTELKPYENNAKLHPQKQLQQIASCIHEVGFINPIIIDEDKVIIAGHGRYEAAKLLGLTEVPTISVHHLSKAQVKAYRLADNQLTMNSGYDYGMLKIDLRELSSLDINFDLEITGFETAEIDTIIEEEIPEEDEELYDDAPAPFFDEKPVTQLGDIWQLGKHLLICGDSTKAATYAALMGDLKAQAIITDPPYNVKIDGHVCGRGKIKHREFVMGSGMTEQEFIDFLGGFMQHCTAHSVDGSLHYVFMDARHIYELITAARKHYDEMKSICVWNKTNAGLGSLYRSKHEFVGVFKYGTAPHINNIMLGATGRYRTTVWDYAGVNSFGPNQSDLAMHPTVKPVAMIADAIKDCTRRGQVVLDPFAGSGTTLIACQRTGRIARCIEFDPHYCDVIIRRWHDMMFDDAVHVATGETFSERAQKMEAGHDA